MMNWISKLFKKRPKYVVSWLGKPSFQLSGNGNSKFGLRQNLILEIRQKYINQKLFCTIYDEDVLIPLAVGDTIEASLAFYAFQDDGVGHQFIYVNNIRKVK